MQRAPSASSATADAIGARVRHQTHLKRTLSTTAPCTVRTRARRWKQGRSVDGQMIKPQTHPTRRK